MKTSTKLSLIVGLAAGYVLGARAGRERYDQISTAVKKLWSSKPVQTQVDNARGLVNKYVPSAVESGFRGAGKVASNLVSQVLDSRKKKPEAPTGTAQNPAN